MIIILFLFYLSFRFGDGYTVKVWLCKEANQHCTVSDHLKLYFPGIQFKVVLISCIISLLSAKKANKRTCLFLFLFYAVIRYYLLP